uniref:Serine racemase n=1 Tax=Strigamia maritima TaxID=126957 RepID=T1JBN4_STRMM
MQLLIYSDVTRRSVSASIAITPAMSQNDSPSTSDTHLAVPGTPPVFTLNGDVIQIGRRGSIILDQSTTSSSTPRQVISAPSTVVSYSDVPLDPWCDPDNPVAINFQDISAAAYKIKDGIIRTPCDLSHMSYMTGMDIFFKKEFLQYTGSFKERGARYTLLMLTPEQQENGVIAASAGNHALALSYHGQDLGIPVTVIMPSIAPIMKVQACSMYGADVVVKGNDIGECRAYALRMARDRNLVYINGYDHPHILAVIPIGGGGLIAGAALAVKNLCPDIQIIGVEPESCASFKAAYEAGKPVYTKASSTIADGLAVPTVGVNAFATVGNLIDKIVTVSEEMIAIAILRLVELEKAVVEGAGAAALAAVLAGSLPELRGKRVVIPLCGGNIDTTVLGRCLDRGLAADGRLVKFTVSISDRPGGIAEMTKLLADLGISIKDIVQERAWLKHDIFSVQASVVCESRDKEHAEELRRALIGHVALSYLNMAVLRVGRLAAKETALFLCDMQEKFRPTIKHYPAIIHVSNRLLQAVKMLDMPVIVTEQYPKGLGRTVKELGIDKYGLKPYEKTQFSMMIDQVENDLQKQSIKSVLICGIEAHVCVQNTVLHLLEKGYDAHVIVDGCSSRNLVDRRVNKVVKCDDKCVSLLCLFFYFYRKYAFIRMQQSGAFLTTSESVILGLVCGSSHPKFKEVQKLITPALPDTGL